MAARRLATEGVIRSGNRVRQARRRAERLYRAAISTIAVARTVVEVKKPRKARRNEGTGACATSAVMRVPVGLGRSLPQA